MIITTTPSEEGRRPTACHGIVVGEATPGGGMLRDIFASVTDFPGGRRAACGEEPVKARETAPGGVEARAKRANAAVGVGPGREVVHGKPIVRASGTVVTVRE